LFATIALVAFAAHAEAAKIFILNMTPKDPASLQAGGMGQPATATFANVTTDSGNANASSLKLFVPTGSGIIIKTPVSSNGAAVSIGNGYTAVVTNNGSSIFLNNIQLPLKPFAAKPVVLTMTVDVPCTVTNTTWDAQMFTGSGWSGQPFTLVDTDGKGNSSSKITPVTGACGSITFLSQPATAFAGSNANPTFVTTVAYNSTAAQVQVQLSPASAVPVTATVTASCSVAGTASPQDGTGKSSLTLKSTGGTGQSNCVITASASGYVSANSQPFNLTASTGILSCASTGAPDAPPVGNLDPLDPAPPTGNADWGMVRGLNADGTCGPQTPFSFNLDPGTQTFTFKEDSLGQQTSVEYVILWGLVNKDADAWSGKQPCVSYGTVGNDPPVFTPDATYGCIGDYIPAPLCNSTNVDAYNAVMPDIPNVEPYASSAFTQFKPTSVTGLKAKVCVAQQGVTPINATQVQYWTKFIDQTDTVGRMP